MLEEIVEKKSPSAKLLPSVADDFFTTIPKEDSDCTKIYQRKKTNIEELDRVLGGGFVDSSVVLLGGPPGIGKSTLLLQILSDISGVENPIYISAEESISQVLLRAKRLNINNKKIKIATTSNIEQIISSVEKYKENAIVIIDSIQTISTNIMQSTSGTISQVRFCTQELVNLAKQNNIIVVIVSHITKDGAIAGPKTLEHMVDCVLYFEGDKSYDYRILRGAKNRYGPTDEIGIFSMTGTGLEEVKNPSSTFLSEHNDNISGVAVFSGIEGTRPILSEIQALVASTSAPMPRRSSVGFDTNRMSMLVAMLSSRCRMNFSNKDIYLNIAGGLKISEPSADFAAAASIISASFQKPLPKGSVFFGEISLSGEIRQSHLAFSRIKEAQKLGFTDIYLSNKTENFDAIKNINIHKIKSIKDIVEIIKF